MVDCEVSRETAFDKLVEATVDNEETAEVTEERPVERLTEPTDEVADVVDESDCELKVETSSRENAPA